MLIRNKHRSDIYHVVYQCILSREGCNTSRIKCFLHRINWHTSCTIINKINGTCPFSKLHSFLAVTNLLAHNNITIRYYGQVNSIRLKLNVALNCQVNTFKSPIYFFAMVQWAINLKCIPKTAAQRRNTLGTTPIELAK